MVENCKLIKRSETVRLTIEYECPNKKVKRSVKLINPKIDVRHFNSDNCWKQETVTFRCKICKEDHTFKI